MRSLSRRNPKNITFYITFTWDDETLFKRGGIAFKQLLYMVYLCTYSLSTFTEGPLIRHSLIGWISLYYVFFEKLMYVPRICTLRTRVRWDMTEVLIEFFNSSHRTVISCFTFAILWEDPLYNWDFVNSNLNRTSRKNYLEKLSVYYSQSALLCFKSQSILRVIGLKIGILGDH